MSWTTADVAAHLKRQGVANPLEAACGQKPTTKRGKYNARKKVIDDVTFDSTREANAYVKLMAMQSAGEIWNLQLQPSYVLQEGFRDGAGKWHRPITYRADFTFLRRFPDKTCKQIAIDVKGFATPVFLIKEKLFRAKFGMHIELEIWSKA